MIPSFSIFGVTVRIDPFFFVLVAVLAMRTPTVVEMVATFPLVFTAVLLHELGHALAGRLFGRNSDITLTGFGGLTQFQGSSPFTPMQAFLVSFAGPAVGLAVGLSLLAALLAGVFPAGPVTAIVDLAIWFNVGWAVFNLVPIVGLDGGHMMLAVFEKIFGMRGRRWALVVSMFVAALVVAAALAARAIFMVIVIGLLLFRNYQQWQMESQWVTRMDPRPRRQPTPVSRPPRAIEEELRDGWAAVEARDGSAVLRIAQPLMARVRNEDELYEATHLLAWGRLLTDDVRGASQALNSLPVGRLPDALLEGVVHLASDRAREAVAPLSEALVGRSDDFVSAQLAKAVARSGFVDPVLALLRTAESAQSIGVRPFQIISTEAFGARHFEAAARVAMAAFERWHEVSDAFNSACALAQLRRENDALRWLEQAIELGLPDRNALDADPDLAPLRHRPEFQDLRQKAGLAS